MQKVKKHFLRCDCSMHKANWLYFIPTLKMFAHGKYLEVEIDFLLLTIYWVFSIENYDDES